LRLFGVRPDTLLGKLGLENGDRFEALDDRSLAAEPDARDAFAQAKQKKRFALKVERRGAPLTLVYTFH
jgi:general secretion pathway protein C